MASAENQPKHVLIVEDDDSFRKTIRNVVEMLGYEVREAENGLVAKTIFDLNRQAFDLIISDVNMPEMDGVAFLKHVRASNADVKFILMTGFSEIIEAQQALDAGANEFLNKPFRIENLRKSIAAAYRVKSADDGKPKERLFCRIPVEEFVSTSRLLVDLFVRLSEEKYIQVAYAGDVISLERLKTYKEKKVDFFWVRPEDLRKLAGFNMAVNRAVEGKENVASEVKLKLLTTTATLISQSHFYHGVDKDSLKEAAEVIDTTLSVVADSPDVMTLLKLLQNMKGGETYAHSVAVSVYACMIAKAMGHTSTLTQTRLAMGGLLHDIGKKELPDVINTKSRLEMDASEIALYESHCQRGKDILAQIPGIPPDVIQIVAHHHENNVSTGFPYRLHPKRIHPLAKVVAVADGFICALTRMHAQGNVDLKEVMERMTVLHVLEYDQNIVKALGTLFGMQIDVKRTA